MEPLCGTIGVLEAGEPWARLRPPALEERDDGGLGGRARSAAGLTVARSDVCVCKLMRLGLEPGAAGLISSGWARYMSSRDGAGDLGPGGPGGAGGGGGGGGSAT